MNRICFVFLLCCSICFAKTESPFVADELPGLQDMVSAVDLANIDIKDPFAHATLMTKFFRLHFADADSVGKYLTAKQGLLSPSGHIIVDKRTNSIWVRDKKANLVLLRKLIANLDVSVKQIEITARIVNVDASFVRELGVKLGTKAAGVAVTNAAIQAGQFNFTIGKLGDGVALGAELSALVSAGHANIISQPKLVTLNRQVASIQAGEEVPYQEKTGQGDTSVAFKKAVLALKVTPFIVSKKRLRLDIAVNQDKVSTLVVEGVPAISTRAIKTQAVVASGQTIVLGGLYESERGKTTVGLPILSRIPLVGALFRHSEMVKKRKELLVFITPRIVL